MNFPIASQIDLVPTSPILLFLFVAAHKSRKKYRLEWLFDCTINHRKLIIQSDPFIITIIQERVSLD
jgi:hypothetical protein